MFEAIDAWAQGLFTSPWFYAILALFTMIDAVLPIFPTETLAIAAAAYAVSSGEPNLVGIGVALAVGAVLGDHMAYGLGRRYGEKVLGRVRRRKKGRAAMEWVRGGLRRRGPSVLIISRYIPMARVATTLSMGSFRYPLRVFTLYDIIAAISWGIFSVGIGYLGGHAFEGNPLLGAAVGVAFAILVSFVVEWFRKRAEARRGPMVEDDDMVPADESNASSRC